MRVVYEENNDSPFHEKDSERDLSNGHGIPTVRKSKLLIVDLAGSERLDKSGLLSYHISEILLEFQTAIFATYLKYSFEVLKFIFMWVNSIRF